MEIELTTLDLRYESYRMKNPAVEARLLAAIAERGIEEPLQGVDPQSILLNGFKRYRCAVKLGMGMAPYASLGAEEATAIVNLLRVSQDHSLSILEQAAFLDQLRKLEQTSVAEMAEQLSRSKSWVSMRLGLLAEMSPGVRKKIFSGAFPVYPYMYTLRQFMRMNGAGKKEIEEFVVALSGKRLSVREVEQLAHGYFRGPASLRQAIREGHPGQVLELMRQVPEDADGSNEFERVLLKDLEITGKYMQRVMGKSEDHRLKTSAFHAQANLLTAGILSQTRAFSDSVRKLHDRSGQAQSGISAPPGGHERERDRSPAAHQPQHGAHDPQATG
ncbi:MAG: ParB/RepB/Spo0J family partition protein [Terriglobia bacterium]